MDPMHFEYDGQTLALRCINKDKTSYGGFENPITPGSIVRPEKWVNDEKCGNGIHCWVWGIGRDGKSVRYASIWQVVRVPKEGVNLVNKWKFPYVEIVHSCNCEAECMKYILPGLKAYSLECGKNVTINEKMLGSHCAIEKYDVAHSISCYSAAVNVYPDGIAYNEGFAGESSCCSWRSVAITSKIHSTSSSSGQGGVSICLDLHGKARTGDNGFIILTYLNKDKFEYRGSPVGRNGLKPNTWYTLDINGNFIEC